MDIVKAKENTKNTGVMTRSNTEKKQANLNIMKEEK